MKKLIDYKEEIHTCSKCGLCQSVCPVYKITGNDCSVSRGKFILLNGIIKGDLKLNENINRYLDMCLKCNACKDFCPSNIDARKIFLTAKADYYKTAFGSKFASVFQSKLVFTAFLNCVKTASNTYRFLKIDKIVKRFYPLFLKMGFIGKKIILANEFVSVNAPSSVLRNPSPPTGEGLNNSKIIYFKGCVNDFINPSVKNAAEKVLKHLNTEILPIDFDCCGMPFLSCGNLQQFKKQAIFNLSQIPDDFDFFITDCASCQDAFAEYKNIIEDEKLVEKIDKILEKSININEFLTKNVKRIKFSEKKSITFHKPCHLEDMTFLNTILEKCENVEYIEMQEFDKCCGFSGEFAIKNPKISAQITKSKAQKAIATKADYILTSCPSCVLGLTQGLIENIYSEQKLPKVMNLIEFFAQADEIIY